MPARVEVEEAPTTATAAATLADQTGSAERRARESVMLAETEALVVPEPESQQLESAPSVKRVGNNTDNVLPHPADTKATNAAETLQMPGRQFLTLPDLKGALGQSVNDLRSPDTVRVPLRRVESVPSLRKHIQLEDEHVFDITQVLSLGAVPAGAAPRCFPCA